MDTNMLTNQTNSTISSHVPANHTPNDRLIHLVIISRYALVSGIERSSWRDPLTK